LSREENEVCGGFDDLGLRVGADGFWGVVGVDGGDEFGGGEHEMVTGQEESAEVGGKR